jgi:hypothetical protein
LCPTTPNQTKNILVTSFENEMTLLDNLDGIYEVEQQIELISTIRQSNRTQKILQQD